MVAVFRTRKHSDNGQMGASGAVPENSEIYTHPYCSTHAHFSMVWVSLNPRPSLNTWSGL